MKDELAKTIKSIKEGEKEEFEKIIDKLNPIITKYVRAIYDGDKEDIREEYILALWEAVNKIQYVNSDGECLKYLHTSIKNKFHELYRKQRIHRDNEVKNVGELFWDFLESSENQYSYIICVDLPFAHRRPRAGKSAAGKLRWPPLLKMSLLLKSFCFF